MNRFKSHNEVFDRVAFARVMKEYRLERLWTLQQMANAIGVDKRTVWGLENCRHTPTELTLRRIRRALPGFENLASVGKSVN